MRSAECGIEGRASLPHSNAALCRHLHPPLGRHQILEQHHPLTPLQDRLDMATRDRSSPPLVVDAPGLADGLDSSPVSRTPAPRVRPAPPPPVAAHLAPEACQAYSAFRTPHSALGFIVDQRVAAFGDARPWLDGDDVVQHPRTPLRAE